MYIVTDRFRYKKNSSNDIYKTGDPKDRLPTVKDRIPKRPGTYSKRQSTKWTGYQ